MMADDHLCIRDAGASDCVQNVFQKSSALEFEQSLGAPAHALGFSGRQYDCSDQWDRAYMKVFTAIR